MVSVKFRCSECNKEFHIDELKFEKSINKYSCPNDANLFFLIIYKGD